ncbi:hypothetical protein SAMN06266787_10815 [Halorubrum ezzemoulense]|jgi:hypothetical protein|uniref:Uncharacterized protein n=1 Tax=Halorubrum ezzemoulense TaxID=337243 RepID=A0A238Y2T5_HALEZ|nr:hypothetical protein [Halorubrum ezzemoulense]SNR65282.1 hypothetical protein SAMN06266787_10815 [Halorubrum ezzemoulense]
MSDLSEQSSLDEDDLKLNQAKLRRIRERILKAEKDKLHLDNPHGAVNDIEKIVREEIN